MGDGTVVMISRRYQTDIECTEKANEPSKKPNIFRFLSFLGVFEFRFFCSFGQPRNF